MTNLVAFHRELFRRAKTWFAWAQLARVLGVLAGLAALVPAIAAFVPFAVFVLTALAETLQWRSDTLKAMAERALRMLELENGLGVSPTASELKDLIAEAPESVQAVAQQAVGEPYYATLETPGPARLLQNVQESAWWTKHLAGSMVVVTTVTMIVLVGVSLAFLITSVNVAVSRGGLQVLARVVTAALMLVFSLGIARMAIGYQTLRDRARVADMKASQGDAATDPIRALRVVHDYQLARAAAPLIPDWIYDRRCAELTAIWESTPRS